eukprot:TRINITY_DN65626_c0_g1_i1.p1 TRINITY_DN65626_c0_g1~~TRINITY_DN65626_c0_g1_i1.p1  ORF type:complete len:443 (+),score=131.87 TRINITY_DN65626_c0_g1_i1:76-1329(+)
MLSSGLDDYGATQHLMKRSSYEAPPAGLAAPAPSTARVTAIVLSIVCMNGSWLYMAEALQDTGAHWTNYYAYAYIIQSSYSYCMVPYLGWVLFKRYQKIQRRRLRALERKIRRMHEGPRGTRRSTRVTSIATSCRSGLTAVTEAAEEQTTGEVFFAAAVASFLTLVARYLWYVSLPRTNAAANSAVYQTSSLWSYLLSVPCLGERIDNWKLLALVICIVGTAAVAFFTNLKKEEGVEQTTGGYVCLLLSVITYSAYIIFVKRYGTVHNDPHPQAHSLRLCGLQGVFWAVTGVVFFPILHYTGINRFTLPPNRQTLDTVLVTGVADTIYVVGLILCISLTSPTFAAVSTLLVVPLTVLADWLLHNFTPPFFSVVGMLWILCGFALFTWRSSIEPEVESPPSTPSVPSEDEFEQDFVSQ